MTTTDVAVIGLGAVGAMTLWRLAERGVKAHGYERFGIAHDRGASAGQTRRFSVQTQSERRLTPLAVEALTLWRELEKLTDQDLLHQTGGVIIGPEGGPALRSAITSARDNDLPYEFLEPEELRVRFPQHLARETDVGVTDPLAGYLRPEASVAAAIGRACELGAEAGLYDEVVAVTPGPTGVAVSTRQGERVYQQVVIAPGAWATELVPGYSMVARRLVQAWYLARDPEDFHPDRFGVFERVGDISAYGFPSLDGATVKVGIKLEPHPVIDDPTNVARSVDPDLAVRLAAVIRQFLPGLRPDPVSLQTGIEAYTPDGLPLLGPAPHDPRLLLACGFSGAGFKFAPATADVLADHIITGTTARNVSFLTPARFD
ncbi:MAG: N-methyl-L-tryptophan oxidase [Kribbellaceae bacterium]|nr:N-methyl-L-tryptophan oxidase [Kribbellaceae bacterium]